MKNSNHHFVYGLTAAMLILWASVSGCAQEVKIDQITDGESPDSAQWGKSRLPLSPAEWLKCTKQAEKKFEAECAAEGNNEKDCWGAAGNIWGSAMVRFCGYTQSPETLSENDKTLIESECRDKGSISELSMADKSRYVTFDPQGAFMKELAAWCERVHAEERERQAMEAEKRVLEAKQRVLEIATLAAEREKHEGTAQIRMKIGLQEEQVYEKFGTPNSITESVTSNGVAKQLSYGPNHQITIVNGRVESWIRTNQPRIGLRVATFTPELLAERGLEPDQNGVLVDEVEVGRSAQRAGIMAGSLILMIDQQPIAKREELAAAVRKAALAEHPSVLLLVEQEGEQRIIDVPFNY